MNRSDVELSADLQELRRQFDPPPTRFDPGVARPSRRVPVVAGAVLTGTVMAVGLLVVRTRPSTSEQVQPAPAVTVSTILPPTSATSPNAVVTVPPIGTATEASTPGATAVLERIADLAIPAIAGVELAVSENAAWVGVGGEPSEGGGLFRIDLTTGSSRRIGVDGLVYTVAAQDDLVVVRTEHTPNHPGPGNMVYGFDPVGELLFGPLPLTMSGDLRCTPARCILVHEMTVYEVDRSGELTTLLEIPFDADHGAIALAALDLDGSLWLTYVDGSTLERRVTPSGQITRSETLSQPASDLVPFAPERLLVLFGDGYVEFDPPFTATVTSVVVDLRWGAVGPDQMVLLAAPEGLKLVRKRVEGWGPAPMLAAGQTLLALAGSETEGFLAAVSEPGGTYLARVVVPG